MLALDICCCARIQEIPRENTRLCCSTLEGHRITMHFWGDKFIIHDLFYNFMSFLSATDICKNLFCSGLLCLSFTEIKFPDR